jgi:hypothetical protein
VWLLRDSIALQLVRRDDVVELAQTANVRLVFEGTRPEVCLVGLEETPTLYNFFLGNNPARWRTDVQGYAKVAYDSLYDGTDLVVREEDSTLEYDLQFATGTDVSRPVIRVEGAIEPLRLDAEGALVIETTLGEIRQPRPKAWEETEGGELRPLVCYYRVLGEDHFGFEAPGRSEGLAVVVDPQLLYSTFLGGSWVDVAEAVAIDATGDVVVARGTGSANFPSTSGAFDTTLGGAFDAFVARFPLSGGPPSYSTFRNCLAPGGPVAGGSMRDLRSDRPPQPVS